MNSKHLFRFTVHDNTWTAEQLLETLRRSGIVISGTIHWGVHLETPQVFSINSNYSGDHFEGISRQYLRHQIITAGASGKCTTENADDLIFSFEYLDSVHIYFFNRGGKITDLPISTQQSSKLTQP